MRRRAPYLLALGGLVVLAVALAAILGGDDPADRVPVPPAFVPTPPGGQTAKAFEDPLAYDPERRDEFERRAAAGHAHGLYVFSPGGVVLTAARVARRRPDIERAAEEAAVDADMLEALVFLESGGRDDAVAPAGLEGAVGLTQIVAETAVNFLDMSVDLTASRRLTRRIARAERRGKALEVLRLRRERARVDPRFDPVAALAATGRYLREAEERFGSEELAFVSYHMGIGNLEGVLAAYAGGERVPYAQLYFDSTPLRHREAHERLAALGDDSSNYLWKVLAARDIMRLYRSDPPELVRAAQLQTAKNSAEEVLHPAGSSETFATPEALAAAWDRGEIVALPDDPARTGLRPARQMGELARRLRRPPTLYQGLRPEALALLLYIGAQVRAMAGDPESTLVITSTVRDDAYQRELVRRNREATRNYSLHTTGWAFDVLRSYGSRRQALAFQFVLDRLQALNVLAWVREPAAIHATASRDARVLLPMLDLVSRTP